MYLSINSSVSQQFKNRGKHLLIIKDKLLDVFHPAENKNGTYKAVEDMKTKFSLVFSQWQFNLASRIPNVQFPKRQLPKG